jgi:hypothetical protein
MPPGRSKMPAGGRHREVGCVIPPRRTTDAAACSSDAGIPLAGDLGAPGWAMYRESLRLDVGKVLRFVNSGRFEALFNERDSQLHHCQVILELRVIRRPLLQRLQDRARNLQMRQRARPIAFVRANTG